MTDVRTLGGIGDQLPMLQVACTQCDHRVIGSIFCNELIIARPV